MSSPELAAIFLFFFPPTINNKGPPYHSSPISIWLLPLALYPQNPGESVHYELRSTPPAACLHKGACFHPTPPPHPDSFFTFYELLSVAQCRAKWELRNSSSLCFYVCDFVCTP